MQPALAPSTPALLVRRIDHRDALRWVEVEGELTEGAIDRWSALLRGVVEDGATGVAVDLRGCRAIDLVCLSPLLAAGAAMRAAGGSGVVLVVLPFSSFARRLGLLNAGELPLHASPAAALSALRKPPSVAG